MDWSDDPEFKAFQEISKITEYVYLSGIFPLGANHLPKLKNSIDIFISMTENPVTTIQQFCAQNGKIYHHFPTLDLPNFDISQYFEPTFEIINTASREKKNVLVHCMEGKSRSATIIIAFLYRYFLKNKKTSRNLLKKIISYVKSKRILIEPNEGFMVQLQQMT